MRDILFRGKRVVNGEWVYGSLLICNLGNADPPQIMLFGEDGELENIFVYPETVGQYTGEVDKKGYKIFEDDIVTLPAYQGGKTRSVVYFKNGKFAVDGSNYGFKDLAPKRYEIIGNIHDNPELLKR